MPVEGRNQAEIVEHGRAQQQGQVAHFVGGLLRQRSDGTEVQAQFFGFLRALGVLGFHQDGRKGLAHLIVQLARQSTAFILLGAQQAAGEFLQIGLGTGILFQAPLQLALQAHGVADGQQRQHQASEQA